MSFILSWSKLNTIFFFLLFPVAINSFLPEKVEFTCEYGEKLENLITVFLSGDDRQSHMFRAIVRTDGQRTIRDVDVKCESGDPSSMTGDN